MNGVRPSRTSATINSDVATVFQGLWYARYGNVVANGPNAYFGFQTESQLPAPSDPIITNLPVPYEGETSCLARNLSTGSVYVLIIGSKSGVGIMKNSTIAPLPAGRYTVHFSYICKD